MISSVPKDVPLPSLIFRCTILSFPLSLFRYYIFTISLVNAEYHGVIVLLLPTVVRWQTIMHLSVRSGFVSVNVVHRTCELPADRRGQFMYNWALRTYLYMKDMWSSIDNWSLRFNGHFCAPLTNNARIEMLKKKKSVHQSGKILYISEKWKCTPIHKSANLTNKDWRFLCICLWLIDLFSFISFIYLNVHTFCAKTLLLYFSLSLKLHY